MTTEQAKSAVAWAIANGLAKPAPVSKRDEVNAKYKALRAASIAAGKRQAKTLP